MGTRGITGFRQNEQDKIGYQQFDSYPSGVGNGIIVDLHQLLKDKPAFEKLVSELKIVSNNVPPTQDQIDALSAYTDLGVSNQSDQDWYCLLRETQGEPVKMLKAGYIYDSAEFIGDSLFCEYGYIINLDEKCLEFYKGFQKKPHEKGRYAKMEPGTDGYQPCALIGVIPFGLIEQDADEAYAALEKLDENSEQDED